LTVTVRFGLIGAGAMGGIHVRAVLDARAELVAIAGGTRAPALASEHGVAAESSPDSLLRRQDIDAVIIATPHTSHMPLTQAAASAGKHVFIEKPMATQLDACDAMIDACRSGGVRLMVAHITRFMEATRVAHDLVRSGAIGDIRMVQAFRLASGDPYVGYQWVRDPLEGGAWLDWGSHGCDIVRWFVGRDPTLAFARSTTFDGDVRGLSVMASFAFPDDVMASIWQSYELPGVSLGTRARYVFVGSTGSLDVYPTDR
jgi:predicted dehydrogenase